MRVLITGGAGYIGSVLTGYLLDVGLTVTAFDALRYGGEGVLAYVRHPRFKLICGDVLDGEAVKEAVNGAACVVHLAALVGDRACDADERKAFDVNVDGTANVINAARRANVTRFLLASTASCYGATSEMATEESSVQPLTQYALTKLAAEVLVHAENSDAFQATVLRFATVFGLSPRMRFDLIVNQFVWEALVQQKLTIYSPNAWRSHIHVHDLARALWAFIVTNHPIGGQTYNVGGYNRTKAELVREIERQVDTEVEIVTAGADRRDYRVSFEKLERAPLLTRFPQWQLRITPEQGIAEMVRVLKDGMFYGQWQSYVND